ncbi:hypothetical protein Dsin_013328 [Dipteronia sinensis]|uniref:Uncharacterized protein n=1 Tax=Dipteronia sinensis TaxID=43782 RepID=A0AAE0AJS3_9ROSI|nr:hypothetical protein Dsin_013328 [Dipteronia sinensis]
MIEVTQEGCEMLEQNETTLDILEVVEDLVNEEPDESRETSPVKLKDPCDFIILVTIEESEKMGEVFDMGSSVNMMPLKVYKRLKIQSINATSMKLKMVDNAPKTPYGVLEDVQ